MTNSHTLQEIRQTAHSIMPPGARVLLFGSRARGDYRQDSDWDILILLDKDRVELKDHDLYSYPLKQKGWDMGLAINPVLYTQKDWHGRHRYTEFYQNVESEGIELC